jgi:ubiquinone/menaquinone biosynthesis C-methylase UbiE
MEGEQKAHFDTSEHQMSVRPEQQLWWVAHRAKTERLLRLNSSDFFVDLGCGEGYLTLHLIRRAGGGVGLDLTHSALQVLKQQPDFSTANLKLVVPAGDSISLVDGCADKLLCNHVLEHILDDDAIMQEIHRIVRPGGLVLIGVPLALSPQIRFLLCLRRLLLPRARQLQLERVEPGLLVAELIGQHSHMLHARS